MKISGVPSTNYLMQHTSRYRQSNFISLFTIINTLWGGEGGGGRGGKLTMRVGKIFTVLSKAAFLGGGFPS